jgi:citrate lyase subunit beta/citryl-CoA lyase
MLFVPGNDPELLTKAVNTDADALILDLEDAVRSPEQEERARELIAERLRAGEFNDSLVYCRVNDFDSRELLRDLEAIATKELDGIVYPKATGEKDILFVDRMLTLIEQHYEIPTGHFDIVPLIETPSAALNAEAIGKASDRVVAMAFGSEDYVASLQGGPSSDTVCLDVPRSMIAMGARAADVIPIDLVYVDIHDFDGFRSLTETANKLGFEGSLVIHPEQVKIANEQYSPTDDEVKKAERVLRVAGEMEGKAVDEQDDLFIGPPIIRDAKQTLERHSKIQKSQ